jgi:hypothetical protein
MGVLDLDARLDGTGADSSSHRGHFRRTDTRGPSLLGQLKLTLHELGIHGLECRADRAHPIG